MNAAAALARFNSLPAADAEAELLKCCGSRTWARAVAEARPLADEEALLEAAGTAWDRMTREDWLEAFAHHPRIGEQQLRAKFASTAAWASQEQSGARGASEATLQALAQGNAEYDRRFGHVFLICATGKSADEMLAALQARIGNTAAEELCIAAGEQVKITAIRLSKMLHPEEVAQ